MPSTTLLIGLGKGGSALLPYLLANDQFELVAVCDSNPAAVGVPIAERCGLPCYQNAVDGVTELRPDLVVDATGDPSLASTLYEVRPAGTSVVTGEASRLLWELLTVQEKQRRCEFRFNRLMDDMHSALVVVQDARIKFTNRAFHEMFGYSKRETLGHPYKTILAEDVEDRDLQLHRERMEGKAPQNEYDTKVLHDDGSIREVRVRARQTDWEGRPASLVIMSDVTELRQLQREREQFFRYMVHELRAPLSPVATALELLRKPEVRQDEERLDKLVGLLRRSTDRLESFVRDFLELSRIEEQRISLGRESIDLQQIVEDIVDNQRVLAEDKGLTLTVETWDEFSVEGDEFVVETGVRNLVNNAIKYTREGSVTVSVDHDADSFRIRVSDTGAGLSEEEQEQIFQEFGRIQRTAGMKGTGLGLALVKKLVEAAGGDVWVESPGKDEGSTFTIELPRTFGRPDSD
ncbi:MAG: ATP-binding protein [Candidatus Brocadiia bacterium]